jgi:N-acetylglutamate synthase-like GNAT family acetyltransferase
LGDHDQSGRTGVQDGAGRLTGWSISHELSAAELDRVYRWISGQSYWAKGVPRTIFERAVEGAFCFVLRDGEGILRGFARVITDRATFAYLTDVFVDPQSRGKGAGKTLIGAIMAHPDLQNLRRWMLSTRDAHSFYARFGFAPLENPDRLMARHDPDVYARIAEGRR